MRRLLLPLSGIAIIAVAINHASHNGISRLFEVMGVAYSPDPAQSTFWNAMTDPNYWFDIAAQQLPLFSVPAFLMISGFFIAFVVRGDPPTVSGSFVKTRVLNLLWPYLIWSVIYFAADIVLRDRVYTPLEYGLRIINGNVIWFVPLLMQFYLLAPFIVRWARHRPRLLLLIAGAIQVGVTLPLYFFADYERIARYGGEGSIVLFVWWALYFPLGMVLGFHSREVRPWLEKHRRALLLGTVVFAALSILESELVLRAIGWHGWGSNPNKLTSMAYAVFFALFFLSLDRERIPFAKHFEALGGQTYGIYLSHILFLRLGERVINRVAPFLHGVSFLYVPVLAVIGIGGALLLMEAVRRLPTRRLYPYLFG